MLSCDACSHPLILRTGKRKLRLSQLDTAKHRAASLLLNHAAWCIQVRSNFFLTKSKTSLKDQ